MTETKTRVHTLAKEIGVSSKAIIDKCAAEGIAIKNHMHVLSAGLEATIREWFTTGDHSTSVEESGPVDIDKARATRPSKKKKIESGAEAGVAGEAPAQADESEFATQDETPEAPPPPPVVRVAEPPLRIAEPPADGPDISSAPAVAPPPVAPSAPAKSTPSVPKVAASAGPVAPAAAAPAAEKPASRGPQNVPAPAVLQGPKLIRMDRPEYTPAPRPSYRPSTGGPPSGSPPPPMTPGRRGRAGGVETPEDESGRGARRRGPQTGPPGAGGPNSRHRANPRRTTGDSPTVVGEMLREWRDRDLIERRERLDHASGRGISGLRADETATAQRGAAPRPAPTKRQKIEVTAPVIIKEFCSATGIPFSSVFRKLQELGMIAAMNQAIDADTATLVAAEQGIEIEIVQPKSAIDRLRDEFANRERKNLKPRSPVVTVLGHVDHGKTSLLDKIRNANVAAGESGGITQHIGAYRVKIKDRYVTFLDTPGHEAFTAMRARGAQMTDVVVLVVAADDGVMPQTIEAINHARAAKVPIVVALNKIDLPQADVQKIYGQLSEHQLVPAEWGGETDVIKTSATKGEGVEELLTHLAALTDLLELKADPKVPASGTVIEGLREDKLGTVARVLVQEGTLEAGSIIVCGNAYGRIRAMNDDRGRKIKEAGPSMPVELLGMDNVPVAGDRFYEVGSLSEAKTVAEEVDRERRTASRVTTAKPTTLESLLAAGGTGDTAPTLQLIVKADVQGSVDVLKKTLNDIPSTEVKLNILHAAVGNVSESDIALAEASQAIIVGFHVAPDPAIQRMADERGVEIRIYKVIYNLTDEIRQALEGMLTPTEKIESRGRAEVRQVFNITKVGKVAGCAVREGVIARSNLVRVLRDGVPIKEGASLASLKRVKDDAREVRSGLECGIRIEGFDDVKPGDIIEAYEVVKVGRKLGPSRGSE